MVRLRQCGHSSAARPVGSIGARRGQGRNGGKRWRARKDSMSQTDAEIVVAVDVELRRGDPRKLGLPRGDDRRVAFPAAGC